MTGLAGIQSKWWGCSPSGLISLPTAAADLTQGRKNLALSGHFITLSQPSPFSLPHPPVSSSLTTNSPFTCSHFSVFSPKLALSASSLLLLAPSPFKVPTNFKSPSSQVCRLFPAFLLSQPGSQHTAHTSPPPASACKHQAKVQKSFTALPAAS